MKKIARNTPEHFWSMVSIKDEKSCWEWMACKSKKGYGSIHWTAIGEDKAHRVAYILAIGNIPSDMCVLHKCDNRSCCNPNHLYAGTNAQNVIDKISRGRQPCLIGERNGRAILSSENILEIREMRRSGYKLKDISAKYGVTMSNISQICLGKRWTEVAL